MMKRGTIWVAVLLVGCFSEAGPKGSPPGGSTSTSTSDGTTTGAGSTSGETSGSTGGGGSTGALTTGATAGSTGEGGGPFYGPCNMLGACDDPLEQCLHPNWNADVCGAPCQTGADCPPGPPGQSTVCLDLFPQVPGAECYLACPEAGADTCPYPLTCVDYGGNPICTEVVQ